MCGVQDKAVALEESANLSKLPQHRKRETEQLTKTDMQMANTDNQEFGNQKCKIT